MEERESITLKNKRGILVNIFSFLGMLFIIQAFVYRYIYMVSEIYSILLGVMCIGIAMLIVFMTYAKVLVKSILRRRAALDIVIEVVSAYNRGEMTMLQAVATTDLSFKEFMRVIKDNDIELKQDLSRIRSMAELGV